MATPKPSSPPPASSLPDSETDDDSDKESVESSILAAIAEAVDVLVEDSSGKSKPTIETEESSPPERAEGVAKTDTGAATEEETDDEASEGDDIGDEIQRIIASYSRNRKKDDQ